MLRGGQGVDLLDLGLDGFMGLTDVKGRLGTCIRSHGAQLKSLDLSVSDVDLVRHDLDLALHFIPLSPVLSHIPVELVRSLVRAPQLG